MARVVKRGGRVVVLEITTPSRPPLSWFFDVWFDRVVPGLGESWAIVTPTAISPTRSSASPAPDELAALMSRCGLERVGWLLTAGGIIALHHGVAT